MAGFADRSGARHTGIGALTIAAAIAAAIASTGAVWVDAARPVARDASSGRPLLLAHLSEQTLPAEEMHTMAASPSAEASPAVAPPAGAGATATGAANGTGSRSSSDPQGSATSASPVTNDAAPGNTVPAASSPGEPPPMGEGASAMLMVSDSPLAGLIGNASSPARAVSLRLADRAREDILNGKTGEAIQSLTRALSVDSSDPYVYFYLGRAYLKKNDDHQALTFFQRAEIGLAADPIWLGETLGFEGACYEQLGKTAEAIAAYRRAIDSSPNNLMARTGYTRLVSAAEPPPLNGPPSEQAPGTANGALQPPPAESPPSPPPSY